MTSTSKIPRGKPKSGRVWKSPGQKSGGAVMAPSLKPSWKKRELARAEKKAVKVYEKELKETAEKEKEERRKRIEERRKMREENAKKAEVVQKITNVAKLKRLSKKQLKSRRIETR